MGEQEIKYTYAYHYYYVLFDITCFYSNFIFHLLTFKRFGILVFTMTSSVSVAAIISRLLQLLHIFIVLINQVSLQLQRFVKYTFQTTFN